MLPIIILFITVPLFFLIISALLQWKSNKTK
jgi:hypothetical protein